MAGKVCGGIATTVDCLTRLELAINQQRCMYQAIPSAEHSQARKGWRCEPPGFAIRATGRAFRLRIEMLIGAMN
jgi:hypothetical protein